MLLSLGQRQTREKVICDEILLVELNSSLAFFPYLEDSGNLGNVKDLSGGFADIL